MNATRTLLRGDRRGLAALEFALVAPMLLLILGGITDFGLIMVGRSRLASGVAQGGQFALLTGAGVSAAAITTNVQNGATRAGLTETVTVTVTGPACYCVTSTPAALGSKSALSGVNTCTATCPANASGPGTFVTIAAKYTYQPLMPLYSLLSNPTVTQTTTVRLQ
jgi:Flp pilus assembly protein TadG